jgi:60 kDa SS-A/Ro ribonucleoprotein
MKTNIAPEVLTTHEGGRAVHIDAEAQLRRTVMSCMLFEKNFYENGEDVAKRIADVVPKLPFETVASIAIEARTKGKLRHAPLLIARECLRHFKGRKVGDLIAEVIQRPDEAPELLAMYWKDGKRPLAKQLKLGLARAIQKFDEYQLKKWDGGSGAIKIRDVIFLTHAKPRNHDVASMFARLVNKEYIPEKYAALNELDPKVVGLKSAETWENRLSRKEDAKVVFTEMITERKLGAMAMLRNLRKMDESKVPDETIRAGLEGMKIDRVLPFRFIAAAKYAPRFEPELEKAMYKALEGMDMLKGNTILLVDVSGSMSAPISQRSDMTRLDAACGLAVLIREIAEKGRIISFSDDVREVPPRRGFALRDAIVQSQPNSGTWLGRAVQAVNNLGADRLIVITDEQSHDSLPAPKGRAYMIKVGSNKNGVGYGKWCHVDGWSEATVAFINEYEKSVAQ